MSSSFETLLVEDCYLGENIFPDLSVIILTSMENDMASIKAIRTAPWSKAFRAVAKRRSACAAMAACVIAG